MQREELEELHYITPITNMPFILRYGILSYRGVSRIQHNSIAMEIIQNRRAKIVVPGGRKLHEYANLYLCARNPMLYKRQNQHDNLCVLRIDPKILDIPDVVITDGNASSEYVRFAPAPQGLSIVDRALTFADYWTHPDQIQYYKQKFAKCAEVLVPDRIDPGFISGAYVSCQESLNQFNQMNLGIEPLVNRHLFFR